jgi:hypothetical protein
MKVLGLDPGGTTGWASVEAQKKRLAVLRMGTSRDATLADLDELFKEADVIVVEDFKVRPKMAVQGKFNWNSMDTTRIIGAAQTLARIHKKKFVLQQPAVKPMGYGYAGLKYVPGKKGTHAQDAIAHACFFLVTKHYASPAGNDSRYNQSAHLPSNLPKSHNSQAFELRTQDIEF